MEGELERLKEKRRNEQTVDLSLMSVRSELIEEVDQMLEEVRLDLQRVNKHQLI